VGIVLDSSILITAEKQRFEITEFFSAHAGEQLYLAAISAAERLHGVERSIPPARKAARLAVIEHFLEALELVDYDLAVARTHATPWAPLAKVGTVIGPYDMIIAASALTHGHKLATLNESEFNKSRTPSYRSLASPRWVALTAPPLS
jgi:tRNA(fMet)-specific endonuclease VapC